MKKEKEKEEALPALDFLIFIDLFFL